MGNLHAVEKNDVFELGGVADHGAFSDDDIVLYKIRSKDLNFVSFDVPQLKNHIQYLKSQYKTKYFCNDKKEYEYRINCCAQIQNAKTDNELFEILKQIEADLSQQQFERDIKFYIRQVYFAPACTEKLLKFLVHNFYNMSHEMLTMHCLQHGFDLIKSIERKGFICYNMFCDKEES